MEYTYTEYTDETGWEGIKRSDGAFIPKDPSNSDYQEYLKSLDEASTL
jgi:hypothetical protein